MNRILLLLGAFALLLSTGCISTSKLGSDYAAFIRQVPAATITDISTDTKSPLYSFHAGASGITTDASSGEMTVTNGTANLDIPLWGFTKQLKISGLKIKATKEQLDAAAALTAVPPPPTK